MRGFVRVSAAVPQVKITDFHFNASQVLALWKRANEQKSVVVCFPELCLTGYSAKDLFSNMFLLQETMWTLAWLLKEGKDLTTVAIIGMPIVVENNMYNCAVAIQGDKVLGVIPKSYIPNYGEFEEPRWFREGRFVKAGKTIDILGQQVPFGTDFLLSADNIPHCVIGVEICEDMWVQTSPHIYQVNFGATIIANLSASNFTIGKSEIREFLARSASDKGKCCYIYTSATAGESSELAWDGQHFICENGVMVARGQRFKREEQLLTTDVDVEALVHDRITIGTFGDCATENQKEFRIVYFNAPYQDTDRTLLRKVNPHPFIPNDSSQLATRCWEVFEIQTSALQTRLERMNCQKIILGLSGGLDSTLAALSAANTLDTMGLPRENLICLTMPGFGTTNNTKSNAKDLVKHIGARLIELSINDICMMVLGTIKHFAVENINTAEELLEVLKQHPEYADITFENIQARVRTLILMTCANRYDGLVLGTGDLSEKALGWSTYAGDQISMFDINSGVPKTLIQFVIKWVAQEKIGNWNTEDKDALKETLFAILDTPITPELLPADFDGEVTQVTEEKIGPYELNDFFLYWHIRYGASPQKILDVARNAFEGKYGIQTLKNWLKNFYSRFMTQQFKRNATADGPKIGMVDLSPRASWRMSTDIECKRWIEEVEWYS
jgi:NAD+ synthase (glutamine-hydrolysing)